MILIRGNSGCRVSLVDGLIHKTADDPQRLFLQMEKQILFRHQDIKTPRVLDRLPDGFSMEYINALSIFDLINAGTLPELSGAFSRVFGFIDDCIDKATIVDCRETVLGKYKSLGFTNLLWEKYLERFREVLIPISYCHGDLTLSNMLVKGSDLYFIDFLDSYIDSPLQDIVKLRQDTRYLWSLDFINDRNLDLIKISIFLKHLDDQIHERFSKYRFYQDYYDLIQFINLLRLLPYTKDSSRIIQWINNICQQ